MAADPSAHTPSLAMCVYSAPICLVFLPSYGRRLITITGMWAMQKTSRQSACGSQGLRLYC